MMYLKNNIFVICIFILLLSSYFSGCINSDNKPGQYVMLNDTEKFDSIQEAIANSKDGDTIKIYPGTYHEILTINTSINLIGTNKQETIIICDEIESESLITINESNCNIENLTLIATKLLPDKFTTGIQLSSSFNKISNLSISGFYFGIRLMKSSSNEISFNKISNNTDGIELTYASNNDIYKNEFSNNNRYALYIGYIANDNTVTYNLFRSNQQAILISKPERNIITDNILVDNNEEIEECCGSEGKNTIKFNTYR